MMLPQSTQRTAIAPVNTHEPLECQSAATSRLISVSGTRNFHASFINWSMRRRGTVARTQMKTAMSAENFRKNQIHEGMMSRNGRGGVQPPRKSVTVSPVMANRPRYSPRKKSAYLKPEYSVRYPAMISDSASGKSNGARFVSAHAEIIKKTNAASPHGVKTNQWGINSNTYLDCAFTISFKLSEPTIITTAIVKSTSGIS